MVSYFSVGPDIPITNAVPSSVKSRNPSLRYDSTIDSARVDALLGVGSVLLVGAGERAFTDRDFGFRVMIIAFLCCGTPRSKLGRL